MSAPMAPPTKPSIALCGRIRATALWLAGPRVEARVSSPRLAMTRLVLTDTPVAERRGQHGARFMPAAGVAGAAVVLGGQRLGVDDRALVPELFDQDVVARGEVDVVGGIAPAGAAHVLRVERVLEGEDDAVHRHRLEVGVPPVRGIELSRPLQRVRVAAEDLANGGRADRQRT